MERVFYNLHHQLCTSALRKTTGRTRSLAEHLLLILAVCGFGALLLMHLSFVYRGKSVITGIEMNLPDGRPLRNMPLTCLSSIRGFQKEADITHLRLGEGDTESWAFQTSADAINDSALRRRDDSQVEAKSCLAALDQSEIYFSYSRVKGYLQFPLSVVAKHNLTIQYVTVSKTDHHCFGEPFLQKLVFSLVGADTVMMNWLLALDDSGFVYNPRTEIMYDLSEYNLYRNDDAYDHMEDDSKTAWITSLYGQLASKFTVVVKTSFLYFITTTLVSFTLRETQERMLDFTHQLQARVRSRRPVVNLVMSHLVDNLLFCPVMIGMIFFLVEFYRGDKFLAFMVLSVVWVCEVFSVIRYDKVQYRLGACLVFLYKILFLNALISLFRSLRSSSGIHFFPRIFFLLFALFHFYLFSFPFGFSYTALGSTVCFMIHSMIFFWHRFELPAVALGLVTIERPRMGRTTSQSSVPPLQSENNATMAVPSVAVPQRHPLVRQQSQGTSSSLGRMSRPGSSLFNAGEDGDESYMFFMDGEVVMHRGERQSVLTTGSGSGSLPGQPITMDEPTDSGSGRVGGIPDHVLAEVGVGPPVDDELETLDPAPEDAQQSAIRDEERETSALQAILDANETPRTGNLSQGSIVLEQDDPLVRSAPSFPILDGGE